MARLYLNLGRRHDVAPTDLTSFLQAESELTAEQIGPVQQHDRHTYVDVQADAAAATIQQLAGKLFHERPIRVELAKPPRRR